MYKIKNIIQDIDYFVVSDKHLVYKQNDNITYKNKILEKEVKDDIILTGDNIFYNKGNDFVARKLINNNKAYFDNYAILNAKPMYWQNGIIIDINDNQLYLFDKFNFIKEKINIIDYNWGIIFLGQEYIFINDINKISSYHIPTAHPLWQFDLSQLGTFQDYHNEQQSYKVEKILGIHNERLYVALNGSMLLELDIATGKITHKWHHLPEKYKEYPDDDFSARLFDLDKAHNALVCLSGRRYDSIDLQTKEYNSVYIGEELKKYDIVSIRHQGDFTNEHISAIAHLKNDTWFQDGIVMFNRKTNKIDFFYKDETFTTGTATPKLAGNKLYQLDLDGNLYIFEKEEKAQV